MRLIIIYLGNYYNYNISKEKYLYVVSNYKIASIYVIDYYFVLLCIMIIILVAYAEILQTRSKTIYVFFFHISYMKKLLYVEYVLKYAISVINY